MCVLRALHLRADRQPGARRLPHRAPAAPPLAPFVERSGHRGGDAAADAGALALQPLPAVLGRPDRGARRVLLPVHRGLLRVGDAPGARDSAVAGAALNAWTQRLRLVLAIPALVGIFFLGQAILDARAVRLDLTPERRYTLSDHARKILDGLPADVRVIAFLRAQDPRNLLIRDLLRQVALRSPRVHVDILDVNRSPALARQYGVDSYGALVVESDGRRRMFSNPREEVLLAALLQVTRQERKVVGWVVGHGEGDLVDTDRHRGFSTARALLEQEYYEVRPVTLIGDEATCPPTWSSTPPPGSTGASSSPCRSRSHGASTPSSPRSTLRLSSPAPARSRCCPSSTTWQSACRSCVRARRAGRPRTRACCAPEPRTS
ncbi:MAG: hypothetical protein E6J76_03795 [Deltaproteobacteria bacterium]|nr:MAG: hypothetical protein E6J76_03795 [Deltaproteobacteria bacterium]